MDLYYYAPYKQIPKERDRTYAIQHNTSPPKWPPADFNWLANNFYDFDECFAALRFQ